MVNQGTQNVEEEVVVASEVVQAHPIKTQDSSSNESTCTDKVTLSNRWSQQQRVIDGEAIVHLLEQDFLNGLHGSLAHKKDLFCTLHFAYGETD